MPVGVDAGVFAAGDLNGDNRPDLVYGSNGFTGGVSAFLNASPVSGGALGLVSAASLVAGPASPGSIVTAYGNNLADASGSESGPNLPLSLEGTKVILYAPGYTSASSALVRSAVHQAIVRQAQPEVPRREGAGVGVPFSYAAPLFFVSSSQVNFYVPDDVPEGNAMVGVTSGSGVTSIGALEIKKVAPALFFMNAGRTVAANALRVTPNNVQTYEDVVTYDPGSGTFVAKPVDFGPEGDQIYLIAYGTGFRNRSSLSNVEMTVGGISVSPAFVGKQGTEPGLDQVNVLLPRSLAGRGEVPIEMTVDGVKANTVKIITK